MLHSYWERCWSEEDPELLHQYLGSYRGSYLRELNVFKEHGVVNICDAACGFGAFYLLFASAGFEVQGFDISETAVEIAAAGLKKYGIVNPKIKIASILDTGYLDKAFDAVVAHAVLDHMMCADAKRALNELFRIITDGGLVLISFDCAEPGDYEGEHTRLEDGTLLYTDADRDGMLFHPYDRAEIGELLGDYKIIFEAQNSRERIFILQK